MYMFEKLVEYKKQHKNTMVPDSYDEDPKLGWWVTYQRRHYNHGELLLNRIDILNLIDFEWGGVKEAREQTIWMSMFQKFVGYKEQHKDTKVPKQDPKLTRWVSKQRIRYKNNELLPKRLALLNSIGFNRENLSNCGWVCFKNSLRTRIYTKILRFQQNMTKILNLEIGFLYNANFTKTIGCILSDLPF
jgi:hypothetical protein